MVKEIYIRDKSDPYYEDNLIDFTDETESVITQIRVILGTEKGAVFGTPAFGINIEDYIFKTTLNATNICEDLDDQIEMYVYKGKNTTVSTDLKFGDSGKGYDYALLDIYINGKKAIGFLIDKNENNG
jgi:hypothetical protein